MIGIVFLIVIAIIAISFYVSALSEHKKGNKYESYESLFYAAMLTAILSIPMIVWLDCIF